MAKYDAPSGQDPLDFALRELAELKNRVQALEGRRLSTWDRADHTIIPAPVEGQHLVNMDDESIRYYSNGAWRTVGVPPIETIRLSASTSLGTSMTALELSEIGGSYNTAYSVNAGDLRIEEAGVYLFHMNASGFTLAVNVDSVLFTSVNVTSGSQGTWSSKLNAGTAEGYGEYALRIDSATTDHDVNAEPNLVLAGWGEWATTATFPVTIQFSAYIEEDRAGVAHTEGATFIVSAARLGSLFE